MRNLLADDYKKSVRQEYLLRLFVVLSGLLTASFVIGILSLFPTYILSDSRYETLLKQETLLQASIASLKSDTTQAPLALLNKKLSVLALDKEEKRLTEALMRVLEHRSETIAITSLSFNRAGELSMLKIKGVAEGRDALLTFTEALKSDGRFEKVELPVSNLAKESEIIFDLTLSGDF